MEEAENTTTTTKEENTTTEEEECYFASIWTWMNRMKGKIEFFKKTS